MGGYLVDTADPAKDGLLCSECNLILKQAVQTYDGIRLCQECFYEIAELPEKKSKKGESILDDEGKPSCYPDNAVRREVKALQVICRNKKLGCDWVGHLEKYFKEHEAQCKFQPVDCQNKSKGCNEKVPSGKLTEHLLKDCEFREITCQYCSEKTTPHEVQDHYEGCSKYPLECDLCHEMVNRDEMPVHKEERCPNVKCICGHKLDREGEGESSVASHLRSPAAVMLHILTIMTFTKSIVDSVQSMEDRIIQLELKASTNSVPSLQFDNFNKDLKKAIQTFADRISPLEVMHKTLVSNNSKLNASVDILQKALQEAGKKSKQQEATMIALRSQIEQVASWETSHTSGRTSGNEFVLMEKKYEDLERQVATLKVHVAELELQLQASLASTHSGSFLWRIPDIPRRRRDAIEERVTSIYSPPFYTGRNGYKMCIRAYLNGDGMGYKTHLSLFFVLMKGEFDPLLKWPFDYKVSLILVDQNHRKHIVQTFKPTSESSSFQRPVTDMNVASGCPQFAKLTALEDSNYVKDDVIFIKCIVDTSRIFHP